MKNMKKNKRDVYMGYIGNTNPDWFDFNKREEHKEVVFWRKSPRPVNGLEGRPFFFRVLDNCKDVRKICGYGFVKEVGLKTVNALWNEYKEKTGAESLDELNRLIFKDKDIKRGDIKLGYYFLVNVEYPSSCIDLHVNSDGEITWKHGIQSGKCIDKTEIDCLSRVFGDSKLL